MARRRAARRLPGATGSVAHPHHILRRTRLVAGCRDGLHSRNTGSVIVLRPGKPPGRAMALRLLVASSVHFRGRKTVVRKRVSWLAAVALGAVPLVVTGCDECWDGHCCDDWGRNGGPPDVPVGLVSTTGDGRVRLEWIDV